MNTRLDDLYPIVRFIAAQCMQLSRLLTGDVLMREKQINISMFSM